MAPNLKSAAEDVFVNGNGGVWGAIARHGLPVVLTTVLVGFLIILVLNDLRTIETKVEAAEAGMASAKSSMSTFAAMSDRNTAIQIRLLQSICLSEAKQAGTDPKECVITPGQ